MNHEASPVAPSRRNRGATSDADTINLQLLNTLETARDEQRPRYGCSWDMTKGFYSVYKLLLILLCWQRLGFPSRDRAVLSGPRRCQVYLCTHPPWPWSAGTFRDQSEFSRWPSTRKAAPVNGTSTALSPSSRCLTCCLPCSRIPLLGPSSLDASSRRI